MWKLGAEFVVGWSFAIVVLHIAVSGGEGIRRGGSLVVFWQCVRDTDEESKDIFIRSMGFDFGDWPAWESLSFFSFLFFFCLYCFAMYLQKRVMNDGR